MARASPHHNEDATGDLTDATPVRTKPMKIKMTIGYTVATATLIDSEASRDFASLLPLRVPFKTSFRAV